MRAEKRIVTRIWHPEPVGALHDLGNGMNAEVLAGDPAYQVTSGEIVRFEMEATHDKGADGDGAGTGDAAHDDGPEPVAFDAATLTPPDEPR